MKTRILPTGLLIFSLLISISGAVYYKIQASDYEARWGEAMSQLETALRTPKQFRPEERALPDHFTAQDNPADQEDLMTALRAELQEKEALITRLTARTNSNNRTSGFRSPAEQQAKLEELKNTDPKKYEELMARREEFRQSIQNAFSQKAATLLDRDTTNLDEKELAQYETMLTLMNETWELTERMTSPETPPEERREIRETLAEKTKELRPLLQDERESRFIDLGLASGYTAEEAVSFAKFIDATIHATSLPGGSSRNRERSKPPPAQ